MKVKRKVKIRNQYNQVPYLIQNTSWESDKNTRKHNTQEASPFPAGDHKAATMPISFNKFWKVYFTYHIVKIYIIYF